VAAFMLMGTGPGRTPGRPGKRREAGPRHASSTAGGLSFPANRPLENPQRRIYGTRRRPFRPDSDTPEGEILGPVFIAPIGACKGPMAVLGPDNNTL